MVCSAFQVKNKTDTHPGNYNLSYAVEEVLEIQDWFRQGGLRTPLVRWRESTPQHYPTENGWYLHGCIINHCQCLLTITAGNEKATG